MTSIKSKTEMKILIVDSHETSRHVIAILLHKLGYKNILEAGTKLEAEKIVEEHTRKSEGMNALVGGGGAQTVCDLDLIILDKDVKPDNGIIYLAQLRQKFDAGSLPILYTAMKDGADELSVASSAGANDTLVKPFTHDKLSAKIAPMVSGGKAPVIQSFSFGGAGAKKEEPVKPDVEPSMSLKELRAASETKPLTPPSIPSPSPPPSEQAEPSNLKKRRKEKPKSKIKAGGSSFQRRDVKKVFTKDDPVTATLKDGKIDGHYHIEVDIIGGGENCFWAKQEEGENRVKLYYLTAKGQSTGMEAKEIDLDDFMHTFYFCEEYGCSILDRLDDS